MKLFDNITIVGVGLIGGSIGLAVKKRFPYTKVTGVFRRRSTLKRALRRKAVDIGTTDLIKGVKKADLIILAAPVLSIPRLAREAIRHAKKGAMLTDVGSTKAWIVEEIEKIAGRNSSSVFFVGSHPMAGSEHAGVEFARADLLNKAPCIVTRTNRTDKAALRKIIRFWSSLGARVEVMSPLRHDMAVSLVSHLPHIVAFSLAGAVPESEIIYAAEGFNDTTRVASSDPRLWADIFLTNKKEIMKAGKRFIEYYKRIVSAVARGDYSGTVNLLKKAKSRRDRFLSSFAENPELSSSGMNARVVAVKKAASRGFLLRRIPPKDEWMLRPSGRRASYGKEK